MNKDKPTVLVVDDVADNVQVLLSALKNDFSVLAATNGKDAIELSLGENQPDIILLDVLMPDMDGYEVCKRLKADDKTKDIPVIFITILDENESELKGLELGAVDYITKPIIPELVRARVSNHIELKHHRDNLQEMLKEKDELMINQSSNAAMGEMIEMIVHQWRQPLTSINSIANTEIVKIELGEKFDSELLKISMENITNTVEYLSRTLDDFKGFFLKNKEKNNVKMVGVIATAQNILGDCLDVNNISISIKDDNHLSLETNVQSLLQVFINLIKNAKEALKENRAKDRSINITVSDDDKNIITTFCDNGGGVPEDIIDKIFESHFSTKDKKDGTGIGLYMSKIIVEKHLNGTISVENSKDGACFKVTIPK